MYDGAKLLQHADITLDSSEVWTSTASGRVTGRTTYFEALALHEIGHTLGLGHYDAGTAVMNSSIAPNLHDPTPFDAHGIQASTEGLHRQEVRLRNWIRGICCLTQPSTFSTTPMLKRQVLTRYYTSKLEAGRKAAIPQPNLIPRRTCNTIRMSPPRASTPFSTISVWSS
jgi:hypothetical protein